MEIVFIGSLMMESQRSLEYKTEKMNRYDFIRFGGYVQWADDSTDTLRKMQVCLPVKDPVSADTLIELISTDEDNPEEVGVSYSVRAAELLPWLDLSSNGYWQAMMTAETNGAGMNVLAAMLKESQLCLMESIYLMLQNDAYMLFPVLCHYFPKVEDMFQTITWENREYLARKLTIFRGTHDEEDVLVSLISLENRLIDGETGVPISDEAEEVDGEIYYYLTDEEMLLPDEQVIPIVESA